MNKQLVKNEIQNIIDDLRSSAPKYYARHKQYDPSKTRIRKLEELGVLDCMPEEFGNSDAKAVIEAIENEQIYINFDAVDTFSTPLQEAMQEPEPEPEIGIEVAHEFEQSVDETIDTVVIDGIEFHFDYNRNEIDMFIHASHVFDYENLEYIELDGSRHDIKTIEYRDEDEKIIIRVLKADVKNAKQHLQRYPENLPKKEWYTVTEMAEYHGVSANTIYRLLRDEERKQRELPCALHTSEMHPSQPRSRGQWIIPGHLAESWQRDARGRK